jgi:predicted DCC family thiol-disulfide oxidoreductase YuxK
VNPPLRVTNPPEKPLVIYDGECAFCCRIVDRWRHVTGTEVEYLPFQNESIAKRYPEVAPSALESAVHLVEINGEIFFGARAVLGALAHSPNQRQRMLLVIYERSPQFATISESVYSFVARNRRIFSLLARIFSKSPVQPCYQWVRSCFLRLLAITYLIAFVSLWPQIEGLISSRGVLPVKDGLKTLRQATVQYNGLERYHLFPTLSWLDSSDGFLHFQCAAGVVLSLLLLSGIAPAPCLFLLWLVYLSLATVGREFLAFQWDNLLLEAGFLAIFLAPLQILPWKRIAGRPSILVIWLFRWLLFRLMFESGWGKLLSGDPAWRHLTALTVHYQTQPLPTPLAWYVHQLPAWFQTLCTVLMFGIELIVPLLIWGPGRFRVFACAATILLQVIIFLTGNYGFFNLLAIAICIFLIDDEVLKKWIPRKWQNSQSWWARLVMRPSPIKRDEQLQSNWRWPKTILIPLTILILAMSSLQLIMMFRPKMRLGLAVMETYSWVANFRTFNSYGLFAEMTMSRPEIIIQGSNDGRVWFDYEFKYKPGDTKRSPKFIAPYQPRLDWQMWFAALGNYRQNPWFINLCVQLLEGSPETLGMLKNNPFPWQPPRYVRALVYEYHFTDWAARRKTGAWWERNLRGVYLPVLALRD